MPPVMFASCLLVLPCYGQGCEQTRSGRAWPGWRGGQKTTPAARLRRVLFVKAGREEEYRPLNVRSLGGGGLRTRVVFVSGPKQRRAWQRRRYRHGRCQGRSVRVRTVGSVPRRCHGSGASCCKSGSSSFHSPITSCLLDH